MRWILIPTLAASILLAQPVLAELPAYSLVKEKSTLKFYAIQNGAPIEGSFADYTADIRFDPEKLAESSVTVEVGTGSVSVANDDIAQNIKAPDWLSAEAFPKAVFKSTKISRMLQSDNYYAEGQFTLRGKAMPVTLNFQLEHIDDKGAIAKGSVTLLRNSFGVGQGVWAKDDAIKNEVRVEFRVVTEKNNLPAKQP